MRRRGVEVFVAEARGDERDGAGGKGNNTRGDEEEDEGWMEIGKE